MLRRSRGPAATRRLASRLGRLLAAGDVVSLAGELGAGKTCFAEGLARGLGVPETVAVPSPSFNIVLEHAGRIPLYHLDLYRLQEEDELIEIGLDHYLYGDGACVVEWFDRFPARRPAARLDITIAFDPGRGAGGRTVEASGHGERGERLLFAWLGRRGHAK